MATTYGINFPFLDSQKGDYLRMTETTNDEIRSNLIHLLLTKKGTRFPMPDFGTRIMEFIFDQNDSISFGLIEEEIREGVKKYIPNLDINEITITDPSLDDTEDTRSVLEEENRDLFRVSSDSTKPYTAKVKIDYTVNNGTFSTSEFVIINI